MANILDLIKKLCPNGVEYKKLGEVCEFKRGKNLKRDPINYGNYPVISGGLKPAFYANVFNCSGESILISGSGVNAGYVSYWNQDIFVADSFYIKTLNLNTKYVYYFLKNIQNKLFILKKGAGIPHVYPKDVKLIPIPIPPLEVQEEIVKILDTFTSLTAELTAELTARKKQYEHYRNSLLTFDDSVERKKLGEVCEFIRGGVIFKKSDIISDGPYVALHYGKTYKSDYVYDDFGYYLDNKFYKERYFIKKGLVIISTSETIKDLGHLYLVDTIKGAILGGEQIWIKNNLTQLDTKYLYYYLSNSKKQIQSWSTGQKVYRFKKEDLYNFLIPIPPLSIQEDIVKKLDAFSDLVSNISIGLPAEIEARKKQYEYYRKKLLAFN